MAPEHGASLGASHLGKRQTPPQSGQGWKHGDCFALPVGSHPESVTVGETRVVERVIDGKKRTVEERKVVEVKYENWDGRCRACFP